MNNKTVYITSDHAGYDRKIEIAKELEKKVTKLFWKVLKMELIPFLILK